MKTSLTIVLSALLITTAFADEPTGRYQLVGGTVEIIGRGGVTVRENAMFRIDTETGRTFKYACGAVGKDQKLKEFWSYVPEVGEAKASE